MHPSEFCKIIYIQSSNTRSWFLQHSLGSSSLVTRASFSVSWIGRIRLKVDGLSLQFQPFDYSRIFISLEIYSFMVGLWLVLASSDHALLVLASPLRLQPARLSTEYLFFPAVMNLLLLMHCLLRQDRLSSLCRKVILVQSRNKARLCQHYWCIVPGCTWYVLLQSGAPPM